jgi:hypothetical protein
MPDVLLLAENVIGDLDDFIGEISKHIGLGWKFLARSLGFEQTDVDAIEYKDRDNLREQIFQMFYEWKRMEGSEATTSRLLAAMKDAELKELMKTLREKGFIVSSLRGTYVLSCVYVYFIVYNSSVIVGKTIRIGLGY